MSAEFHQPSIPLEQTHGTPIDEAPMYDETQSTPQEAPRQRRQLFGRLTAATALVGSILAANLAPEVDSDAPAAQAPTVELAAYNAPSCYGDYCSGQYPDQAGCDQDAQTLAYAELNQDGSSVSVEIAGIGASSSGDTGTFGTLELRWSELCGTAWARLRTRESSDVNFVRISKDDGYWQQREISGQWAGSDPGNYFTPMVYGRGADEQFRASVYSQGFTVNPMEFLPDETGTYWVNPQDVRNGKYDLDGVH